MNRENYDFELVDREDNDDAGEGGAGGRKKRAGELYDPFAEGSEDEGEAFGVASDSESESPRGSGEGLESPSGRGKEGRYRDEGA